MTFLIVLFVLVMQFLWLYIDELVGKGLSLGVIIEFLAWGSATLIPYALPLATLLASIMTLGNFGENNELLAMKAAGISLPRILYPLIIVAVLISIGAFFASNDLIPLSYKKIYTLRDDIGKTKDEIKIPTGVFYNGIDGYTLRVNETDKNNIMHDVMVYDHSANKGNISLVVADSGKIRMTPDKSSLIFILYNGTSYEEDNKKTYNDTTYALTKVNFDEQEVIIPLENYAFQKSDDSKYDSQVMTKSMGTLRKDKDSIRIVYNSIITNQLRRAVHSMGLNYTSQFDTSNVSKFKGTMEYDSLFKWRGIENQEEVYRHAAANMDNQVTNIQFFENELYQSGSTLRRTITETFRKFTLSFACLLFFFIGAPIGAIIRKGGLGTPVIISMLFFVLYWVVDISGKKLANDGAIAPVIGAFVSTFVLLPIGVFLTWKSTRDSNLFNLDAYTNFLKNLFTKAQKVKNKIKK